MPPFDWTTSFCVLLNIHMWFRLFVIFPSWELAKAKGSHAPQFGCCPCSFSDTTKVYLAACFCSSLCVAVEVGWPRSHVRGGRHSPARLVDRCLWRFTERNAWQFSGPSLNFRSQQAETGSVIRKKERPGCGQEFRRGALITSGFRQRACRWLDGWSLD